MLRSIRGTAKPRSHLLISGQNLWRGKNCSGLWKILVSKTPPRNLDAAAAPLLMMEIKTTSQKDLLLKSHKFILTVSPVFNLVQFFLFGWWWFHDEEKMELKLIFLVFLRHRLCEGARHKQGYLPGEPIINDNINGVSLLSLVTDIKIPKLKSFRSRGLGASKCQSAWCLDVR